MTLHSHGFTKSVVTKPEQEQFSQEQVASGRFKSTDEVLAQAFKLLEEKYQEYEAWIAETRRQVNEAATELDRGEGIPLGAAMEQLQGRLQQIGWLHLFCMLQLV